MSKVHLSKMEERRITDEDLVFDDMEPACSSIAAFDNSRLVRLPLPLPLLFFHFFMVQLNFVAREHSFAKSDGCWRPIVVLYLSSCMVKTHQITEGGGHRTNPCGHRQWPVAGS